MKPAAVVEFFDRLAAANPDPRGELQFINAYTLLVAVVLSAQATDASVNRATEPLFRIADTPAKMLKLGEKKLKEYVRTIGLYNTKAKNIIRLSQILIDQFGSEVPADRDILQTLPGVGRKTANVVLNIVFRHPTMAVDTHIFRVCNRTGLAPGTTPDKVEQKLEKVVPEGRKLNAHHWLILHGRYVCKARKPDCPVCVVRDLCRYKAKTLVSVEESSATPTPTRPPRAPLRRARGRGE
jgi:endonuclease-3